MSIQRKWRYGVYHTLGRPLEIVIYVISREPLWLVESQICLQLILCDLYRANHVLALHRFCQIFQLILRDLYRAKYAGSCPRIAQIFPNFPKWNIFRNQKVVIPERFGRVHTTLQSTYYYEVPMRKKKLKFFKCLTANQSDWFCVWWVGFVWRCFELRWFGSVFSHCSLTLGRCLGAWSLYLLHSLWPTYSSIRTVDWSPSITETMAVVSKRWCFHVIRFVSYLFGLDGSFKTAVDSAGFYFF